MVTVPRNQRRRRGALRQPTVGGQPFGMARSRFCSLAVGIALAALTVGDTACSSDSNDNATGGPAPTAAPATASDSTDGGSAAHGASSTPSVPENWCVSHMPGEILTAEEAVVRFQGGAICPGYVTVRPGTPITFQNIDDVAHTVVIGTGLTPDEDVLESTQLTPGQSWAKTFDEPQTVNYFVDGFEGFRGTLEVRAAG